MSGPPDLPPSVDDVFGSFPEPERGTLIKLRDRIFECAASDPRIGPLHECLKWGQPSYETSETRAGTPLRLGVPKSGGCAIFCHCQTRVITDHRAVFGTACRYDGNRALLFAPSEEPDALVLDALILGALTYRL